MVETFRKWKDFLFFCGMMGLLFVFVGVSAFVFIQDRNNRLDSYRDKSIAHSQLFGENISALVEIIDLNMLMLQSSFSRTDFQSELFLSNVKSLVYSTGSLFPQGINLVLFNHKGQVIFNQKTYVGNPPPSFKRHRDAWIEADVGNMILNSGEEFIYFSRRVEDSSGKFAGIIMTLLDPSTLKERFAKYLDIDVDAIILIDKNNRILIYWWRSLDHGQSMFGKSVRQLTEFRTLPQNLLNESGLAVGETDSLLFAAYQLSSLPFKIGVFYKKERILKTWRSNARNFLAVILLSTLVAMGILVFAIKEVRKRRAATQQLVDHKLNLEDIVAQRTEKLEILNQRLEKKIKERKQFEDQLKTSLSEKQTLLQEIHHRVKNNMNVVSGLLSLHKNSTQNEEVKKALQESQGRIYAMSAVHETLHNTKNLAEIDLLPYLNKLANSLIQTYSVIPGKVQLIADGDEVKIHIDKASPLGLTVNELISNSLKYAFPNDRKGKILVTTRKQNDQLELTIQDDGVGMPEGLDWKDSNTLGLKLVSNLIENQLNGSIDLDTQDGTQFTIKINLDVLK